MPHLSGPAGFALHTPGCSAPFPRVCTRCAVRPLISSRGGGVGSGPHLGLLALHPGLGSGVWSGRGYRIGAGASDRGPPRGCRSHTPGLHPVRGQALNIEPGRGRRIGGHPQGTARFAFRGSSRSPEHRTSCPVITLGVAPSPQPPPRPDLLYGPDPTPFR